MFGKKEPTVEQESIDELISGLMTEEGRAQAVFDLAGKEEISEEHITNAIQVYDGEKFFPRAIYIATKCSMSEKVKELREKNIRALEEKKDYKGAGMAAEEAGMHKRAISFYEKAGDILAAARAAKKAGMADHAERLYLREIEKHDRDGNFEKAGRISKQAEMPEKMEMYKRLDDLRTKHL